MWRHNYVIDRNECLISTLSESINPWVYSLQFLFKSTNNSWRYERKCEWCVFFWTQCIVLPQSPHAVYRELFFPRHEQLLGLRHSWLLASSRTAWGVGSSRHFLGEIVPCYVLYHPLSVSPRHAWLRTLEADLQPLTLASTQHGNTQYSPTRKLRCCRAHLLHNFHVFAQPRNFCHGAQLPRNFGSFWTVFYLIWWLGSRQRPTSARRSCIRPARVQVEGCHRPPPSALPVSGGRARVNVVIAQWRP